jgi:uncharacterized protein YbcC (UPF0753/DUF2309 family)
MAETTGSRIECCLERVARWLPHQGPIKEFIHHNTLHAFEQYPFYEACLRASRLYGSWAFFPLPTYRALYRSGLIDDGALAEVCKESQSELVQSLNKNSASGQAGWDKVKETLLSSEWGDYVPAPGVVEQGLRSRWQSKHGLNLAHRLHFKLFRLLGQFLDQGIAMWGAPHPECTLFDFVGGLVRSSWVPLRPFSHVRVRHFFDLQPAQVVETILQRFLGPDSQGLYERYLLEMCLSHPGWSGMVRELELHPENLLEPRKVSLLDLCALELMAEYDYISLDLGDDFPLLHGPSDPELPPLPYQPEYRLVATPAEQLAQLWQQAFERTYRHDLLSKLHRHHQAGQNQHLPVPARAKVQAFFCLDDREGSLRRYLEDQDSRFETYGFAGFFGVDCVFQGIDDAFPSKHCPAPLHPKHRIREHHRDSRRDAKSLRLHEVADHSHTLMRGFIISQTLGLWSAVKLALSIFSPSLNPLATSSLQRVDSTSAMTVHRTSETTEEGFFSGYSDEEMADRVGRVMQASGLAAGQVADLVVFVGHGASSINNPYFAAYDCGACSGKGGGPNARAIALMANRAEVREILERRGLPIPASTWFLGALHDTTRDEMQYYDLDAVPVLHQSLLGELRQAFEAALALNAKERCRRFANVSPKIDPRDAILAVRRRSVSIFEPRPELNHATNAACIVGRRRLSKGLSLNRRCFLNSYDPTLDPTGEILASLLTAVVPVCGGINMEYYFSRIDPLRYGAGSKLPHNIQGLIGVINGTEGDLLTGLPTQMTEVHDPLRLLFLVEQTPSTALKAARANPEVFPWIANGWIQYLCWDPETAEVSEFKDGDMRPLKRPLGAVTAG